MREEENCGQTGASARARDQCQTTTDESSAPKHASANGRDKEIEANARSILMGSTKCRTSNFHLRLSNKTIAASSARSREIKCLGYCLKEKRKVLWFRPGKEIVRRWFNLIVSFPAWYSQSPRPLSHCFNQISIHPFPTGFKPLKVSLICIDFVVSSLISFVPSLML